MDNRSGMKSKTEKQNSKQAKAQSLNDDAKNAHKIYYAKTKIKQNNKYSKPCTLLNHISLLLLYEEKRINIDRKISPIFPAPSAANFRRTIGRTNQSPLTLVGHLCDQNGQ